MVGSQALKFHTGLGKVNYQCLLFLIHKEVMKAVPVPSGLM